MNEFISPSPSLGSQTMRDQGQASLPSDNAPFYSVPSPPMIAWDAFRDARRAALEQEVAALASVGGVGAVTEQEKASIRQAAGARRKFEAKFTRRVHRKALPLEPFDGLRRTTAPVEAPPIPPHLQSRHPILQGPIAWSMPGASPHSSVDTYRASPVAAVLTLSGGADDIRRALPDVRSAPAVGVADGGGGDDDGGGPSGAESANSSNDATEVPPSSGMKRTASRDVAAILLSLSPPAQASPLIGPLTTAPHAIPSVELSHTTSLSSCVSLLGTPDLSGLTPTQFTPSAFFAGPREHIAAEPWARRGA